MVCDERNHRVQVFELSGKFVTKFGSKGSESGEFRNPVCTANIGDGRIVVCDTNNSRIQLFDYEWYDFNFVVQDTWECELLYIYHKISVEFMFVKVNNFVR